MRQILFTLALFALLTAGTTQAAPVEYGVDRPGSDIRNFDLPEDNHDLCRGACLSDNRCRAWTYVRRGHQGPRPRCWLKNTAPAPRDNPCCVSGTR